MILRRCLAYRLSHTRRKRLSLPLTDALPRSYSTPSNPITVEGPDIRLREDQIPTQSDVLIIGGGLIGWSVAFWMRWTTKLGVTVVERDPTYRCAASFLGLASCRQQFSEPENIQMSLFGSEFIRNIRDYLTVVDDYPLDIEFNPQGCLLLADQSQAEDMLYNYQLQTELGAKVELLDKKTLGSRWPWLNLDDIELGCYGYENEGWFDPCLLLKALRAKCVLLGVNYVVGEVVDFNTCSHLMKISFHDMPQRPPVVGRLLREAVIALPGGSTFNITFANVVNAAGPWAADVARLVEIGNTEQLSVPLPVEPRLRHVYVIRPKSTALRSSDQKGNAYSLPQLPGLDTPFILDPKRFFLQREGLSGDFIVYADDPEWDSPHPVTVDGLRDMVVDSSSFAGHLSKALAHRIPSLASVEVVSAWASVCDYNTVDQNLIIGHHPYYVNMYFCNGSSGHGAQHAIAIGRAVSELLTYGHYKTIDLTRFSFDRFYTNQRISESYTF